MNNPKTIVRVGYDAISHAYRADTFDFDNSGYKVFLTEFEQYLKPGDRVLDLGCGCGVPVARHLARRYAVTGVDISETQVTRAQALVSDAQFVCADMTGGGVPRRVLRSRGLVLRRDPRPGGAAPGPVRARIPLAGGRGLLSRHPRPHGVDRDGGGLARGGDVLEPRGRRHVPGLAGPGGVQCGGGALRARGRRRSCPIRCPKARIGLTTCATIVSALEALSGKLPNSQSRHSD